MYFDTVDCATSNPSISSSPWIRGAPHSGFSWLMRRMRSRRPQSIFGRPALHRDFQRQNVLNPARCQRSIVSGSTTLARLSNSGNTLVIQTSRARSAACSRSLGDALLSAILS
jgi:hypothetical protein